MIDAIGDIFKKKQGYRPALIEEEVTEREEEITVGYKVEDNNKQIFWEKNSVEGIWLNGEKKGFFLLVQGYVWYFVFLFVWINFHRHK